MMQRGKDTFPTRCNQDKERMLWDISEYAKTAALTLTPGRFATASAHTAIIARLLSFRAFMMKLTKKPQIKNRRKKNGITADYNRRRASAFEKQRERTDIFPRCPHKITHALILLWGI